METGHAKTVANFETVVIILEGLGAAYNPNQSLIMPSALRHKLTEAKAVLDALDASEAARAVAIDERQDEYEELDKYVVNIKRAAEVEINDPAFTNDLASIVRKFYSPGKKTGQPAPGAETPPPARTRSTSARGFDNMASYVADILALLRTKSGYKPNDDEAKISAIEAKHAALEAKNNAAKSAIAAYGNAKDARDAVLYDGAASVTKLVKLIKTQLARKPGRTSAPYQQIMALEFRKSS